MSLTTDRNDSCLYEKDESSGQNKCYLVLSQEELDKGYVRPLRRTYKHTVCGKPTSMDATISATYARQPSFYTHTFCYTCGAHLPVQEFVWVADGETVGS